MICSLSLWPNNQHSCHNLPKEGHQTFLPSSLYILTFKLWSRTGINNVENTWKNIPTWSCIMPTPSTINAHRLISIVHLQCDPWHMDSSHSGITEPDYTLSLYNCTIFVGVRCPMSGDRHWQHSSIFTTVTSTIHYHCFYIYMQLSHNTSPIVW